MAASSSKLSIIIFFLLFSILFLSSPASSGVTGKYPSASSHRSLLAFKRNNKNQIPNCSEMASRSQCMQNPKCRWCRSEVLDDMCFSKGEAWRLPEQVFLCEL
ncbi:hypothetical protein SLEP1_g6142 [Rubroshorea leprosula]|uniref:Uncharacterized protein n=1 Tax=Rubroshorea leprosula TaxID=152421 RepID=A0AAV5I509_9ROSI|nr:hypothetical protein SLEP1_g6142 [Rubroshorea leprosula]